MLNLVKGRIEKPLRVVVYGPEGIGKSTFAAQFPGAVFIDTEGSTNHLDVVRFEPPKDWSVFLMELHAAKQHPEELGTLVIDTADWAMRLCEEYICKKNGKAGIEDFGYGKGYTYAKEEWGKALDLMSTIVDAGVNVVLTAHSAIRKFEKPDEMGAYDRYELKMGGKAGAAAAALCKEWADILLFANYKEIVVEVNGKNKVQGGSRVMHTCHTPTWDAKNRMGMPPELPFDYKEIARIVPDTMKGKGDTPSAAPDEAPGTAQETAAPPSENPVDVEKEFGAVPVSDAKAAEIEALNALDKKAQEVKEMREKLKGSGQPEAKPKEDQPREGVDPRILQLCDGSHIMLDEISKALQEMGQAPGFYPVREFPPSIVEAVVVHWKEIVEHINKNVEIPF